VTEKFKGCVGRLVAADRVHIYTDVLPGVIVACGDISGGLGAGAGLCVSAGSSVAYRANFAVWTDILTGFVQYFLIIHFCFLLLCLYEMDIHPFGFKEGADEHRGRLFPIRVVLQKTRVFDIIIPMVSEMTIMQYFLPKKLLIEYWG
jgi:hypothetical protein